MALKVTYVLTFSGNRCADIWQLMIIAFTGYGKSPAIDKLIKPLNKYQDVEYTEYKKKLAEYEDKIRKARKDKKVPYPRAEEKPALRHFIVSDTTTEALANVFDRRSQWTPYPFG